jgi:hypothetical protein
MKKIYALILLSLIAICNIAFGQYNGKIDTLIEMSSMTYEEASFYLSDYEYTDEFGVNEYVSEDLVHSYILDTVDYIQVPGYATEYSRDCLKEIKNILSIKGVVVESYKDEDGADCYYYEGFENDYLLIADKKNDLIIVTTARK